MESPTKVSTAKPPTKASSVEATATATAGETGLGRRERKAEADNLTECRCFHDER
jgi:hypothetical protein